MVEVRDTAQATEAIRSLVDAGMPAEEIHQLVAIVITEQRGRKVEEDAGDGLPVYDVLPEGLIDLPTAARNERIRLATAYNWIRRDRVRAVGRLRAPARGGGYLIVNEHEFTSYAQGPRDRGGRPPTT